MLRFPSKLLKTIENKKDCYVYLENILNLQQTPLSFEAKHKEENEKQISKNRKARRKRSPSQ